MASAVEGGAERLEYVWRMKSEALRLVQDRTRWKHLRYKRDEMKVQAVDRIGEKRVVGQ